MRCIQVFEHDTLWVGDTFVDTDTTFAADDFKHLQQYLTNAPDAGFYSLLDGGVRFNQYVGALQVGGLTIEVLPKTDRHGEAKALWQSVLIRMIQIAHKIPVHTTTDASLLIQRRRVLDAYVSLFITEVESLVHAGLLKRYRREEENSTALRGRLLIHQQVRHNLVHAERFYVGHTVYDRNNSYNAILLQALLALQSLPMHTALRGRLDALLAFFPDCRPVPITDATFRRLRYDRKTTRYKRSIGFAEIILRHYHPDIRRGRQSILAIMFDMNRLWEAYITHVLQEAALRKADCTVYPKSSAPFWRHPNGYDHTLEPDLEVKIKDQTIILDTKWKYSSSTSIADLRQMYAYSHYFGAERSYLLYPDNLDGQEIEKKEGQFYSSIGQSSDQHRHCGLLWVDLIKDGLLNEEIGLALLEKIKGPTMIQANDL